MQISLEKQLQSDIENQLKISHFENKVDCKVVSISNLSKSTKSKIKEEKGEDFLKSADILIGFVIDNNEAKDNKVEDKTEDEKKEEGGEEQKKIEEPSEDNSKKTEKSEEKSEDKEEKVEKPEETETEEKSEDEETEDVKKDEDNKQDKAEETKEDAEDKAEKDDSAKETKEDDKKSKKDKKGEKDEKEEQLNEDAKIVDLTSKMLTTVKSKATPNSMCFKEDDIKTKSGKRKAKKYANPQFMPLVPKKKEEEEEEEGGEIDISGEIDAGGAADSAGDAGGAVDEAETQATGIDLVAKVTKMLSKMFKSNETETNKIELNSVKDIPNAYYTILSFTDIEK